MLFKRVICVSKYNSSAALDTTISDQIFTGAINRRHTLPGVICSDLRAPAGRRETNQLSGDRMQLVSLQAHNYAVLQRCASRKIDRILTLGHLGAFDQRFKRVLPPVGLHFLLVVE